MKKCYCYDTRFERFYKYFFNMLSLKQVCSLKHDIFKFSNIKIICLKIFTENILKFYLILLILYHFLSKDFLKISVNLFLSYKTSKILFFQNWNRIFTFSKTTFYDFDIIIYNLFLNTYFCIYFNSEKKSAIFSRYIKIYVFRY